MNVLANESITMLVKTTNQHIAWLRHQPHGCVRKLKVTSNLFKSLRLVKASLHCVLAQGFCGEMISSGCENIVK